MRLKAVGKRCPSLLPLLVVAFATVSARAEYIYDTYHSTGVADSKKVLQVRMKPDASGQPTDEVEVRTLCAKSDGLRECAESIIIKKDRLESTASAEKAQYEQLLSGIDKKNEADKKTEKLVGGSLTMTGLALAFPPSAPVAIPVALALEGGGIANKHNADESMAEVIKARDPRLESMSASVIKKALSEDVAVSDFRRGDALEIVRSNLKELFLE